MILYIAYYGNTKCHEKRNYVLAATNKIDYISNTIHKYNDIQIISASSSIGRYSSSYKILTDNLVPVYILSSLGTGCRIKRVLDRMLVRIQLLVKLLFRITKNDTVIVYHSLGYVRTIRFAKKLRQFRLIMEVEELYGDVIGSQKVLNREEKYFRCADGFIFPTELLNHRLNPTKKPYAIIHGTYQVEPDRNCKFNDGRIHVVYAGTFDPRKGGASAAAAAEYLDERYHIHIIGFGSESDTQNLCNEIDRVSQKTKCIVTYDGLKSGEEYIRFLQSCDIGLCTQNPNAMFNETSFPSKVLSYLTNGLQVVSIRIRSLETSTVNCLLTYYNENTPQDIAKAITRVKTNDEYNSRHKIIQLDETFCEDIRKILDE